MASSSAINRIEALCEVCTAAVPSIRRLLHQESDGPNSGTAGPVVLSLIEDLQAKKNTCVLCKLVDYALVQSCPEVPLYSGGSMYNADPVADLWKEDLPKDRARCLRVEITHDEASPFFEDVGLSSLLTQARDMAGFKIDGNKRWFQPEIRLLQQAAPDSKQEKNDVGLAREFGRVCSADRLRGWWK